MEKIPLARSASVVGASTLLSRVLGLIRDTLILGCFPAPVTDAFYAAWRLPNMLRRLMGEGALSAAFIPVFSEYLTTKGKREAWELARVVIVWVGIAALGVTVVGIVAAPLLVRLFLFGWLDDPAKMALTVSLTRWLFPYLIFISLCALAMAMLNSLGHFTIPALAPAVLNLSIIAAATVAMVAPDTFPGGPIFSIVAGILVGGALQLGIHYPVLRRKGFYCTRLRKLIHPELRRIVFLVIPAITGLAVLQVNLIVDNFLASFLEEGAVTYLYAANRLIQFPMGIFAIAVSTVAFPLMARCAVAGDTGGFKASLHDALRLVFFITIPAMAGLMVLGRPIISLLFEYGEFLREMRTAPTNYALFFYSVGLAAYGGVAVIVRAFYALEDTRTPVRIGMIAVAANIVLDLILMWPLRHGGLALATSCASILNFLLCVLVLRRRIGPMGVRSLLTSLARIGVATAGMAVLCHYLFHTVATLWPGSGFVPRLLRAGIPLGGGILSYTALTSLFRSPELNELRRAFRKRSKGRKKRVTTSKTV